MLYSVDRIDIGAGMAALVDPQGKPLEVPSTELAAGVREGDLVRLGGDGLYHPDVEATQHKRKEIQGLLDKLLGK